jgi:hypothetical protein
MTDTDHLPFRVAFHAPSGRHWLYVDAGRDPADGAPLTMVRPATPAELRLWEMGKYEQIARQLGVELPRKPSKLKRLVRRLLGRQA